MNPIAAALVGVALVVLGVVAGWWAHQPPAPVNPCAAVQNVASWPGIRWHTKNQAWDLQPGRHYHPEWALRESIDSFCELGRISTR